MECYDSSSSTVTRHTLVNRVHLTEIFETMSEHEGLEVDSSQHDMKTVSLDTAACRFGPSPSPSSIHDGIYHSNESEYYCPLSSRSLHPVDSDDECSIMSELTCNMMEHGQLRDMLLDVPLHDPGLTNGQDEMQDIQMIESATGTSSAACSSPIVGCTSDETMNVASSLLHNSESIPHISSLAKSTFGTGNDGRSFECIPDELICAISSFLDVESLSRLRLVSKRLFSIASRDEAGWKHHCGRLWSQKAHVSKDAYSLLDCGNARKAFYVAGREAVSRHSIFRRELIFDPNTKEGTIWSFRFKATAGSEWTSRDPWWTGGGKARETVFLEDGRVMQYIRDKDDADASMLENDCLILPFQDAENRSTGLDIRWRFIFHPMDLPKRPEGAYLRLAIAGRDVPTFIVHRSPTGNWGFVMENCWGVYASFPLAQRRQADETTLNQRPARMRLRRTSDGVARWLDVADMESEDEEENNAAESASLHDLEDANLSVTTAWEWREALLYNHGMITLPEGDSATAEFDRVWSRLQHPAVLVQRYAFRNENRH